tara:strand:- start:694 stop:948 length:255 start_codon:yes stop_codon:yes gene_type:complete
MSDKYDNTNKGAMWRNETSTPENNQPFMQGKLNVEGKEYAIAGWREPAKDGKKARLDLKIQEPRPQEVKATNNSNTSTTDDIPF